MIFRFPLEVCLLGNVARDRQIPEAVITAMWQPLRDVSEADLHWEGFPQDSTVDPADVGR